jgi:hypothetical protein
MRFSRISVSATTAAAFGFLMIFALRASAQHSENRGEETFRGRPCSERTIRGDFGIKFNGASDNGGSIASVTRISFDGAGKFTGSDVSSFGGHIIRRTLTGTYRVNSDCTGTLEFLSNVTTPPHTAPGDFVIVNGGDEFFIINSEEGVTANGVGKRQ